MPPLSSDDMRTSAYIDGELDDCERAAFVEELVRNPVRSREVAELGELNELVRLAFARVPGAPRDPFASAGLAHRGSSLRRVRRAALVIVVLLTTFGAGWLTSWSILSSRSESPRVATAKQGAAAPGMVLVLASADRAKADATLLRAHELLKRYRSDGPKVEVIVTGLAIKFLKRGDSRYGTAFAKLMEQYPDFRVVVCEATLQALSGGHKPMVLLKKVGRVPTAVQEVVKRLHQGWIYVEA